MEKFSIIRDVTRNQPLPHSWDFLWVIVRTGFGIGGWLPTWTSAAEKKSVTMSILLVMLSSISLLQPFFVLACLAFSTTDCLN